MAKTTLIVDVEYDDRVTDPESLASAADRLLETILSTPAIMEEYGDPQFDSFFVAPGANSVQLSRPTIVVEIRGGALQEAYSANPAIGLRLVDWDAEGVQPACDNRVFAITGEDGRTRLAMVSEFPTVAMDQLPDDTRHALQRAELEPEEPQELSRRWVLYDLDADTLIGTNVYRGYDDAATVAAQANDVLVLPLVIERKTV